MMLIDTSLEGRCPIDTHICIIQYYTVLYSATVANKYTYKNYFFNIIYIIMNFLKVISNMIKAIDNWLSKKTTAPVYKALQ